MKQKMLLAAALVAIPIAAIAQTGMTPEQTVAARQSAYGLSAANFAQLKAQADAGVDVHTLVFPSRQLARWARTLPTMFPAGTNLPTSHALPAVWTDRAGFEAKAAAYAAAAQAGVALGPGLMGLLHDALGSYQPVLWCLVGLESLAVAAVLGGKALRR